MKKLDEIIPESGADIILFYDGIDNDNCEVGIFYTISKDKDRVAFNLGDEDDEEIEYYDVDFKKATWQSWTDYIFPFLKKYRYIVAWGKMMGSFQPYIDQQVLKASKDNAPENSIHIGGPDNNEWKTTDGMQEYRIKELESLIPNYLR